MRSSSDIGATAPVRLRSSISSRESRRTTASQSVFDTRWCFTKGTCRRSVSTPWSRRRSAAPASTPLSRRCLPEASTPTGLRLRRRPQSAIASVGPTVQRSNVSPARPIAASWRPYMAPTSTVPETPSSIAPKPCSRYSSTRRCIKKPFCTCGTSCPWIRNGVRTATSRGSMARSRARTGSPFQAGPRRWVSLVATLLSRGITKPVATSCVRRASTSNATTSPTQPSSSS